MAAKSNTFVLAVILFLFQAIPARAQINVAGTWSSNDGSMGTLTVSQSGDIVRMEYSHSNGRIVGHLRGNVFEGHWIQDLSGRRCSNTHDGSNYWGRMTFTFQGNSYSGMWGYCEDAPGTAFQGSRTGGGVRPSPAGTRQVRTTPVSQGQMIIDNWNTGGCSFTDNAVMNLTRPTYVESVQLWYNWSSGETSLPYTLSAGGRVLRQGDFHRGSCDPYQTAWCEATDSIGMAFPPGSYTFRTARGHVCQNSGSQNMGFIHVRGRSARGDEITVSPGATPQVVPTPPPSSNVDVNGLWKFQNQTMIFYQEGSTIRVVCTYRSGGRIVVWYGEGSIRGNHVRYHLHHTRNTAPDFENGIHEFDVSADGNAMSGTWGTDATPVRGNWTLERVGP